MATRDGGLDPRRCACGKVARVDGWCRGCWGAEGALVVARTLGLVGDGTAQPDDAARARAEAKAVRDGVSTVKRLARQNERSRALGPSLSVDPARPAG